jgi:hypothetical protein
MPVRATLPATRQVDDEVDVELVDGDGDGVVELELEPLELADESPDDELEPELSPPLPLADESPVELAAAAVREDEPRLSVL